METAGTWHSKCFNVWCEKRVKEIDKGFNQIMPTIPLYRRARQLSQSNQLWGLDCLIMSKQGKTIPRRFVDQIVSGLILSADLQGVPFMICGSYRRMKMLCNDIDLVLVSGSPETTETIEEKLRKLLGSQLNGKPQLNPIYGEIQFNIFIADRRRMGAMILFATGSGNFNIQMRSRAKAKGWKLNRYGIYDRVTGDVILEASDESMIFTALGIDYIQPKERNY